MNALMAWLIRLLPTDHAGSATTRQHRVDAAIRQADQALAHHEQEQSEVEARMRLLEMQARRHGRAPR